MPTLQPEYSLVTTSIIIPHGLLHIALIYREDMRVIFLLFIILILRT
jgi:hypothetical protein